jgi:hypothetical protein
MNKLLIFSFSLFILNCDSKNTEVKNQTVETVKKEIIQKQEVVQKSDSSDCECPNPFETAETRIKIDYGNDKYLKFCSWDYHLTDSITAEFRIYDQSDSMLLQGDIPTEFTTTMASISEHRVSLQIFKRVSRSGTSGD